MYYSYYLCLFEHSGVCFVLIVFAVSCVSNVASFSALSIFLLPLWCSLTFIENLVIGYFFTYANSLKGPDLFCFHQSVY